MVNKGQKRGSQTPMSKVLEAFAWQLLILYSNDRSRIIAESLTAHFRTVKLAPAGKPYHSISALIPQQQVMK